MARTTNLYRFSTQGAQETDLKRFSEGIPGCFSKGTILFSPENCAWLVAKELTAFGVQYKLHSPPQKPRIRWSEVVERIRPEMRPEALGLPKDIATFPFYFRRYQKEGILFLLNEPQESGHVWHPTGSGKTISVIVWALYNPGPIVIVTKAAARETIAEEFRRYTLVDPLVLLPESDRRKKDPRYGGGPTPDAAAIIRAGLDEAKLPRVVIVGCERLVDHLDLLCEIPYVSIVFDEEHKFQSHRRWIAVPKAHGEQDPSTNLNEKPEYHQLSNIASAAMRLSANAKRRCGCTATAIPDRPRNLWAPVDLVHPWAFGSPWPFFKRYCDVTLTSFGAMDNSGSSNVEELKKRLSFIAHKVDYSVTHGDLPPKRRQIILIPKSAQDKASGFANELARAQATGRRALTEVRIAEATSRKFSALAERVQEAVDSKAKVIVFTNRHASIEAIDDLLDDHGESSVTRWMAHGGSAPHVRDQIRREYMAHPGPCVLLGTIGAFGESISLHDTDLLIFGSMPINARELWQAEGRVARRGQLRPVLVLYMVAEGTIDEHYQSILLSKLPAVEALLEDSEMAQAAKDLAGMNDDTFLDSLWAKLQTQEGEAA